MNRLQVDQFDDAFDNETGVVVECLRSFVTNEALSLEWEGNVAWARVADLADRHGVSAIVHAQLSTAEGFPPLAEAGLDILKHRYHGQVAARLIQWSRLERIVRCLAGAQVDVIPLKGVALAERIYLRPEMRKVGDIDLLVRPEDFHRTVEVLKAEGYQASSPIPDPHAEHPFAYHAVMTRADNAADFVEVHWLLCDDVYFNNPRSPVDTPAVWSRSREHESLPGARRMSDEDELLYLVGHLAKHGWRMLYGLVDIALYLQRIDLNRRRLTELQAAFARDWKFETTLALVRTLLDSRLPDALQRELDESWANHRRLRTATERTVSLMLRAQPLATETHRFTPWERYLRGMRRQAGLRRTSVGAFNAVVRALTTPDQRDLELVRLPSWLEWAHRAIRPVRLALLHGRYAGFRLIRLLSS